MVACIILMMLMMVKIMSQDHESRSSLMMLMMVNIMIDDGQDVYMYKVTGGFRTFCY